MKKPLKSKKVVTKKDKKVNIGILLLVDPRVNYRKLKAKKNNWDADVVIMLGKKTARLTFQEFEDMFKVFPNFKLPKVK